jgi:DNA-binding transcriptional MocR family regulator
MVKYVDVVQTIEAMIRARVFARGQRILSVREACRKLKVSQSAVFQAYGELERRGLIEARPQSGFYVRVDLRDLPPEPKVSTPARTATGVTIGEITQMLIATGQTPGVIALDSATPSGKLAPMGQLKRAISYTLRRYPEQCAAYEYPPGYLGLRKLIAERSLDIGCHFTSADL